MNTVAVEYEPLALDVRCGDDTLTVVLADGREVTVPLSWFSRLLKATPKTAPDCADGRLPALPRPRDG